MGPSANPISLSLQNIPTEADRDRCRAGTQVGTKCDFERHVLLPASDLNLPTVSCLFTDTAIEF